MTQNKIILVFYCAILIFQQSTAVKLQQIAFYSLPNQMGTKQIFTEDTELTGISVNARSYCVEQGLWRITIIVDAANNILKTEYRGGRVDNEVCYSDNPESTPQPQQYKSIRRIGSGDLEIPMLNLFQNTKWEGDETEVSTIEQNFAQVQNFKSFVLSGIISWTLFSEQNFNGTMTCLIANDGADGIRDYGINSDSNIILAVGSVRQSCVGVSPAPTPSPTTTPGTGNSLNYQMSATLNFLFISVFRILIY